MSRITRQYLPAGTQVTVLWNGRWVRHTLKHELTVQADRPAEVAHPLGLPGGYGAAHWAETAQDGTRIVYNWLDTLVERGCSCGGKGVVEVGMYGRAKGASWRTMCCKACPWRKPTARKPAAPPAGEFDAALAEECRGYLALTDEQLAGYGLRRGELEYRLATLGG